MKKPNIVFILSDDQGAWSMNCAGTPELYTPNLDRIAARGMRFENFFCVSPVCSPARASLLTGNIPSAHGVHDWIRSGNVDGEKFAAQPRRKDRGQTPLVPCVPRPEGRAEMRQRRDHRLL